jgi:2-polyprenyl-6-methoxyphenol hydroxylase-like FAD-dependent oxidoreductase
MPLTSFEKAAGGTPADVDVVVAGGGPVGLMLACELGLAGVRVTVLERLEQIDTTIKAGAMNVPAVEAFYRRGLLPAVREEQQRMAEQMHSFLRQRFPAAAAAGGTPPSPRFAGHFAGIMLDPQRVDEADPDFAGLGPAGASAGPIPQRAVESILHRRAAELGIDVRRGMEVTGLAADGDGVTVLACGAPAGGGPAGTERIRAGWLVGCDGGRSLVRRLAGFEFPGTGPEITGHQAIVEMTGAEGLQPGWNRTDTGTYAHGPVPGRILTVEFDGPPADRDAPVTAAELQASIRNVSGAPVTVTGVHSATRFTDNARQATAYRRGRVLLAGDAAHVHSPFGGQGLNLGIGDAMNLGWKLAGVVRGWAPVSLLDSYTAERHPVGAWVLDWTRAQVALMRPEPRARALREVVIDLAATTAGATYFVKKISGVGQGYDLGPGPQIVGRSAPDLALSDGTRLADHLHDGHGLLLDLADQPKLRELGSAWPSRVRVVTADCPDEPSLAGLLVRPDGYVAWAGRNDSSDGDGETAGVDAALHTWFGPSSPGQADPYGG